MDPVGGVRRLGLVLGFEFSFGLGEKRKLSVSSPDMSSHELITSGSERKGRGSDQRDLGSEFGSEEGKKEPRVKREGGVVVVGVWGGSRVRRP